MYINTHASTVLAGEAEMSNQTNELTNALRKTVFGLEALAAALGRESDKVWELASGLYDARAALAKAESL